MRRALLATLTLLACAAPAVRAQWLAVSGVASRLGTSEHGGPYLLIDYQLEARDLSRDAPAYVFVRLSEDGGKSWRLLPPSLLRGDGAPLASSAGRRKIVVWGSDQLGLLDAAKLKVAVRALPMARVPAGTFKMGLVPGGGYDESQGAIEDLALPAYHMARYEVTVGMYADYLREASPDGRGWIAGMANPEQCGIQRRADGTYTVSKGREDYPVNYVSWYGAQAFLAWTGLRLPTEAEFQKAYRGGFFLDGDESRKVPNPLPERKYPWGNDPAEAAGLQRCTFYVDRKNGLATLTPVGRWTQYASPYGICDLAGNVAEWTLDRYATSYHAGIDGYRMLRGGSYMDPAVGCDSLAGASQLPANRNRISGFRGVIDLPGQP